MDDNLKRNIILDNYQNAVHRERKESDEYIHVNTNNSSCIDNIDLYIKLNGDIIEDVTFDGEACVICISSTSILVKLLIGKTKNEGLNIIDNYFKMIEEEKYDVEIVGEANVFDTISKQPSRKKCATLTWVGMKNVLEK